MKLFGVMAAAMLMSGAAQPAGKPGSSPEKSKAAATARARGPAAPIAFPHPLITEVLYAVPTGDEGDANQDGQRSATGDEFVELYNPHDKPIQLRGYTICDSLASDNSDGATPGDRERSRDGGKASHGTAGALRFVFPEFELKPGEIVVVFNGYKQHVPGECGTRSRAPNAKNEKFNGAWVFTMEVDSQFAALANKGDCLYLLDPSQAVLHAITWGKPGELPPNGVPLVEKLPECKGSAQRLGLSSIFAAHEDMRWSDHGDAELFSPGVFDPSFVPIDRSGSEKKRPDGTGKDEPAPTGSTPKKQITLKRTGGGR